MKVFSCLLLSLIGHNFQGAAKSIGNEAIPIPPDVGILQEVLDPALFSLKAGGADAGRFSQNMMVRTESVAAASVQADLNVVVSVG